MYRINIEKKENENSQSVMRRFASQMRSSGIVRIVRNRRFEKRKPSKNIKRQQKIRSLKKREEYEKKVRLGIVTGK